MEAAILTAFLKWLGSIVVGAATAYALYLKGESDARAKTRRQDLTQAVADDHTRAAIDKAVQSQPPPLGEDTHVNSSSPTKVMPTSAPASATSGLASDSARTNFDGADKLRDDWQRS